MEEAKTVQIKCKGADNQSIEMLKPFQGALKNLSKKNYEKLKKEILTLGFSEPVSVWLNDGNIFLLNGHQRHRALTQMKDEGYYIPKIPVNYVEARDISEAKRKVLALTSQYGEITDQGLYEFMSEAEIGMPELEENFVFPEIDFDKFKAEFFEDESPEGEDEIPPVPAEPKTKLGDIYQLGDHRLMCGDSTNKENLDLLLNGATIDMIFTDPPYGIGYDDRKNLGNERFGASSFGPIIGDFNKFNFPCFDTEEQFWWGANYYCQQLPENGVFFVWDKKTEAMQKNGMLFTNDFELCWSKKKHKQEMIRIPWAGAISHEPGESRHHPMQKPVKLAEFFIEKFSESSVLDLYLGSGSTLIACEKTGRKCFGMELDPGYCDIIVARWEKYTGKKAVLLGS